MRNILPRNEFKRDFRRALKGRYRSLLAKDGEFDHVKKLAMMNRLKFRTGIMHFITTGKAAWNAT